MTKDLDALRQRQQQLDDIVDKPSLVAECEHVWADLPQILTAARDDIRTLLASLDAVTALEQKWREMDPQPKDDTYIDGINEGRRECLRELAAVLTGEVKRK